ncbi:FKBP-type peptidyl-prolyl cis-trans isomerase [Teredinibacter purpureus]|uniref:Peptidyl-prolyl cis-trans isomerase n=1 Tax=Teredinibacter purpureus TaxID=2731756 RepID=A0A0D3MF63_9GAMM|nr:FKBP-type peptidyl-prolyl cis-trans isomerase [Teredinibacter purpureus]AIH07671.1 FKBP-type peptidyl-prolyl cis-trans isomerase 1 [Teredinibacter purpureus]
MKKFTWVAVTAAAALLAGCGGQEEKKEPTFEALNDKVSYILGFNMASQAKTVEFEINPELIALAISEVNTGAEQRFDEEEMRAVMTAFQTEQQAKQQELMAKRQEEVGQMALDNAATGKAFLDENAAKEGVVVAESGSGLQYKIERAGTGAIPTAADTVLVNYRGTTLDGEEFDSSYSRGEPAKFRVSGLIKGWVEALQLMPVGSKWTLYIPGDIAYGDRGIPNRQDGFDIEPNELLVFEMELLDINPEDKPAEPVEAQEAAPAQ